MAFSDTGGGHRSAALAISAALVELAPATDTVMADPYAMSGRWPFNRLGQAYPKVVDNASWLWRTGFRLTDTRACTSTLQAMAWPVLRSTFRQLRDGHPPDVIVSTHPLLTSPLRRAFPRTPIAVVVTDLVSGHSSWYHSGADLLLLPTEAARARAVASGVPLNRTEVVGLPVSPAFVARPGERETLCTALGWSTERPTVLLVGGGDGVGPLAEIAIAIDQASLGCDVAVVTGRNRVLEAELSARSWNGRVHVYGFVRNLGDMMRATAALVTKAGPGTISEACAAGCPIVLWGAIPGQETGNIGFVEQAGAGGWAPSTASVLDMLHDWFVRPGGAARRARAAECALQAARPHAARDIASRVLELAAAGSRSERLVGARAG